MQHTKAKEPHKESHLHLKVGLQTEVIQDQNVFIAVELFI